MLCLMQQSRKTDARSMMTLHPHVLLVLRMHYPKRGGGVDETSDEICAGFQTQISYHGSEDGGESEDSEGENQELAQIDRGVCVCVRACAFPLICS